MLPVGGSPSSADLEGQTLPPTTWETPRRSGGLQASTSAGRPEPSSTTSGDVKPMRILVVGGAGYIGSVTVAQALAAGHEVTVLDSLVNGHKAAVSHGAEFVNGDLASPQAIDCVLRDRRPEGVVYYAGFIAAGEAMEQPGRYFANNVGGAINLLSAMASH